MSTPRTSLRMIVLMRSGWKKPRGWLREKQPHGRSFQSTETSHIGSTLFSQRLSTRLLLRHRLRLDATHQGTKLQSFPSQQLPRLWDHVLRVVDGSPAGVTVAAGNTKVWYHPLNDTTVVEYRKLCLRKLEILESTHAPPPPVSDQ